MRNSPDLISIGYEGRSAADLIAQLTSQAVSVLVDVRLNPISRKPGLSKTALAAALHEAGIRYVHARQLGNPKDNRDGYRLGEPSARGRFEAILREPAAMNALEHVSELLEDGRVALLCYERDHAQCHRAMVTDALRELEPSLLVHEI